MTAFRTCPLCEATCGLEIEVADGRVERIRGDAEDVFSHGFLCPKGVSLKPLHEDPDRLRVPLVGDGVARPPGTRRSRSSTSGSAAVREAGARRRRRLPRQPHRALLLGVDLQPRRCSRRWARKNLFTASTVDQMPKQVAAGLMFGGGLSVPVPDLDRTDYLLVLGANPLASNGSLMTAPDMRGRLRAMRARGGQVVVVDPRRSRTAEEADEHLFIRPGTDALFLFALVHVLVAEGLVDPAASTTSPASTRSWRWRRTSRPGRWPARPGSRRRRSSAWRASSPRRPARGGLRPHRHLHAGVRDAGLVAGRRAQRAHRQPRPRGRGDVPARGRGRVQHAGGRAGAARASGPGAGTRACAGAPEVFGELPVGGAGRGDRDAGRGPGPRADHQRRQPGAVRRPNGGAAGRAALEGLDFMVSLDIYLNETTRHADVDPAGALAAARARTTTSRSTSSRSATWPTTRRRCSTPKRRASRRTSGGRCCAWPVVAGRGRTPTSSARRRSSTDSSPQRSIGAGPGATPRRCSPRSQPRVGPERILDFMLRTGPYERSTLADLEAAPARDRPRPAAAAPARGAAHADREGRARARADRRRRRRGCARRSASRQRRGGARSAAASCAPTTRGCTTSTCSCAGRRAARCTSTPTTPRASGSPTAADATVRSGVGEVVVPVEVTDAIMPGVVSIPHGWGHDVAGTSSRSRARTRV